MTPLLLDECLSPAIVSPLWARGIDTVHLRDRGLVGVSDTHVWTLAQLAERAIVTINHGDFLRLAQRYSSHGGLLLIPSGGGRAQQLNWVLSGVEFLRRENAVLPSLASRVLQVFENGVVLEIVFVVPAVPVKKEA